MISIIYQPFSTNPIFFCLFYMAAQPLVRDSYVNPIDDI